jgi:hypothetical protein
MDPIDCFIIIVAIKRNERGIISFVSALSLCVHRSTCYFTCDSNVQRPVSRIHVLIIISKM